MPEQTFTVDAIQDPYGGTGGGVVGHEMPKPSSAQRRAMAVQQLAQRLLVEGRRTPAEAFLQADKFYCLAESQATTANPIASPSSPPTPSPHPD